MTYTKPESFPILRIAYKKAIAQSWHPKMEIVKKPGDDYSPFGMLMPGRQFNSDKYRFGFNGKEMDNEVHGSTGAFYDYGFRVYDPRIAKFLSVDPLTRSYPWYTPYQFAGNKPIMASDLDGLEERIRITPDSWFGKKVIELFDEGKVARALHVARIATNVYVEPKNNWEKKIYGENGSWAATSDYDDEIYGTEVYFGDKLIHRFPIEPQEDPYEGYNKKSLQMVQFVYEETMKGFQSDLIQKSKKYLDEVAKVRNKMATVAFAAQGALGLIALEVPVFSTNAIGLKFGISAGTQLLIFGEDADALDATFDAITTPGWSALCGGAFDWAPLRDKNKFRSIFHNKSGTEFAIDFGTTIIFDGGGDLMAKGINPYLKNAGEKQLFQGVINLPTTVGKYGTNKAAKE